MPTAPSDHAQPKTTHQLPASPAFSCPFLEKIPPTREAVEIAFAPIPALPLRQSWPATSPAFRPGYAKIAYTDDALLVLTEFTDEDVFNPITDFNTPAYLHGDVCEAFILPANRDRYVEIHATPDGTLCQFAFKLGQIARIWANLEHLAPGEEFAWEPRSEAQTWKTDTGWSAMVAIPFSLIGATPSKQDPWHVAICRYDHTHDNPDPVLSTTANLPSPNFHLTELWNPLTFGPR